MSRELSNLEKRFREFTMFGIATGIFVVAPEIIEPLFNSPHSTDYVKLITGAIIIGASYSARKMSREITYSE